MGADLGPLSHHELDHPAWLRAWFGWLDSAVQREVRRVRKRYELSVDELRGLYVSDEFVDSLLASPQEQPDGGIARADAQCRALCRDLREGSSPLRDATSPLRGAASPLREIALEFGLSDAEVCVLVICLAPEARLEYQALYAYLADDVTRRRPTVDVCLRLIGGGRELLDANSSLYAEGLVEVVRAPSEGTWRGVGLQLADPIRAHLLGIARRQPIAGFRSRQALGTLAQAVSLTYTWDDLVLPAATCTRLRELSTAVSRRREVFDDWGFRRLSGGHSSLRMLFSGASGTGKTMSAAVVAREAGLELYQVDVSAVVSKYIGETEKNLEAIFTAAEGANVLLFFDEADALFGKRSEVSDAHDRYANIEVSYLLQRIERYDGVLILATNIASNMDEAFSRRLHGEIEFPLPDEPARELLWRKAFPTAAPVDGDMDPALLAKQFQLTGGDIRNVALAAAFLAAHDDVAIGLSHVMRALARQRHRQGKLPTLAEFGPYLHLVRAE